MGRQEVLCQWRRNIKNSWEMYSFDPGVQGGDKGKSRDLNGMEMKNCHTPLITGKWSDISVVLVLERVRDGVLSMSL